MPNYSRIPECPYFVDERKNRITCEDVPRTFDSTEAKAGWLNKYCCTRWEDCPYADVLNRVYDRIYREGADMEKELLRHKADVTSKELKSFASKLGKAEKKMERMQKKIDELRAVNRSLINRNEELDQKNRELYRRWREDSAGHLTDKILEQADKLFRMYKNVACYLLDHADGKTYEEDVEAWADGKVYTIYREYDDTGRLVWQVVSDEIPEEEKKADETIKE